MAAFDAAIAAGFGIECDVRVSRDGQAFLFHDTTLTRMTGTVGTIEALDAAQIERLQLTHGESIPRLSALLARCPLDWPLLLEIKTAGWQIAPLCAAVARDMPAQPLQATGVMSFHPMIGRWFARHTPQTVCGLVVTGQHKHKARVRIENALALWLAKPDFLACDIRDLPTPLSVRARRSGIPVLTWTVRSDAARARAVSHADQIIFERVYD